MFDLFLYLLLIIFSFSIILFLFLVGFWPLSCLYLLCVVNFVFWALEVILLLFVFFLFVLLKKKLFINVTSVGIMSRILVIFCLSYYASVFCPLSHFPLFSFEGLVSGLSVSYVSQGKEHTQDCSELCKHVRKIRFESCCLQEESLRGVRNSCKNLL